MRLFLLLSLTACTTATPRLLADGAPLAPPEPRVTYTPTGAGLPEYWVTPEAPKVERSPHTRVLPPTKEPGLWAGGQPRASYDDYWKTMEPIACGVRLPDLEDVLEPYQQIVRRCAFIISVVGAVVPSIYDVLQRLSPEERRCFVGRMYEHCANADRAQIERFETFGQPLSQALWNALRQSKVAARAFAWEACRDDETDDVKRAVEEGIRLWAQLDGRPNATH